MNNSASNYEFCCSMMRLRDLITGKRWATEHDTFDLYDAAALMRLPTVDADKGKRGE